MFLYAKFITSFGLSLLFLLSNVTCDDFDHPINGSGGEPEQSEQVSGSDEELETENNNSYPYSYYDLNTQSTSNNNKDDFDLLDFHPDPGGLVYTFPDSPTSSSSSSAKNNNNNKFVFSKFLENWEAEQKQRLEKLRKQQEVESVTNDIDKDNQQQESKSKDKEKSKDDYNNPDSYHWGEHGLFTSPRKNPYTEHDEQEDAVYINGVKKQKTKDSGASSDLMSRLAIIGIFFAVAILLASSLLLYKGISNYEFSKYVESPTLQDPLLKHP